MLSLHQLLRRASLSAVVVGTLLAVSGCIPTAWLPDSSGFVYVKPLKAKNPGEQGSGQLVHFDLKNKASRVLVNDIAGTTLWPAVSPEGKRIAIARFKGKPKEPKTVQIAIYDTQGKQVQQSKELAWTPAGDDSVFGAIGMLFWSPKDDMIVVTDMNASGIYNVRADSIKMFEKAMPAIHGGSPIRPDGKGFLAVIESKDKAKKPRIVFLDWAGAETAMDTAAFEKIMTTKAKTPPKEGEAVGALVMGMFLPSGWQGNTAWAGFKRLKWTYEIDTAQKSVAVSEAFASLLMDKKGAPSDNEPFRYDFAGDVSIHVHQFSAPPEKKDPKQYNRVVVIDHKTKKETPILDKAVGAFLLSPSPDGNYVTMGIGEMFGGTPGGLQILVISSKGELHSKIILD